MKKLFAIVLALVMVCSLATVAFAEEKTVYLITMDLEDMHWVSVDEGAQAAVAEEKDLTINVTKAKQLTNMRSKSSDEKAALIPPKVFSLEEALEYIKVDEYVEVTPHNLRMRKIVLDELERKRLKRAAGIVDDDEADD